MEYPCGQCPACLNQRAAEWGVRLIHEAHYWDHAQFTTLTYNNEHLPKSGWLVPQHLTDFLKRVNAKQKYNGRGFAYFASGEYGEKKGRPHYHAILFGLPPSMYKPVPMRPGRYSIPQWKFGFLDVKPLIYERAKYTAKYMLKQQYTRRKQKIKEILANGGKYPPWKTSSNGLGLRWALDHREELEQGFLFFRGKKRSIPRYYIKKLDIKIPHDVWEELQRERELSDLEEFKKWNIDPEEADMAHLRRLVQQRKNAEARYIVKSLKGFMPS